MVCTDSALLFALLTMACLAKGLKVCTLFSKLAHWLNVIPWPPRLNIDNECIKLMDLTIKE